jgi:hypothetical protein
MVARVRALVHGCVRASLRACVRMYGRTCVRPSRYTILTVTQRSMHNNIFSLHRRPYVFITTIWTIFFARYTSAAYSFFIRRFITFYFLFYTPRTVGQKTLFLSHPDIDLNLIKTSNSVR